MVYTLAQGTQGYNNSLHYSLYGGVEQLPNPTLAAKELLPLVAIPAAAIALLGAIINFHIPAISPVIAGSEGTGSTAASTPKSIVLASSNSPSGPSTAGTAESSPQSSKAASTSTAITPLGSDNGQGIIGGMGGGDSGDTGGITPPIDPVPTPTPTEPPLLQTSVELSNGTAQVGVDVFVTPTTTASAGVSLTL